MYAQETYTGYFIHAVLRETPVQSKAYIDVRLKVVDHASCAGEVANGMRWLTTDKVSAQTVKELRAGGWRGFDVAGDLMVEGLGSQLVEFTLEENEYEGQVTLAIAFINQIGSDFSPEKRAEFGQRFASLCQSIPAIAGPPSADANTTPTQTAPTPAQAPTQAAPAQAPASAQPVTASQGQSASGWAGQGKPQDDDIPF